MPDLSGKQMDVFNTTSRFTLVTGPRLCGKTIAVLHRIMRHAWETPEARFAIFSKTIKNAKAGVWADLVEGERSIMRQWEMAGLSSEHADFEITVPPKQDGATRVHYFKIRNYWGSESRIELHSLDYDGDVEKVVFGTRFSGIYFAELQNFKDPKIFQSTKLQLRMTHLDYAQHIWMADTNPPEEGPDHFAFKLWFEQLEPEKYQKAPEDPTKPPPLVDKEFLKEFKRIDFTLDDNPYLDPRQKAELKATYAYDPEGYDRFVLGIWTKGLGNASKHFGLVFKRDIHVYGNISSPNQEDWEYLNPLPDCPQLFVGWDIGEENHAVAFLHRRLLDDGRSSWDLIDEIVSLGERISTEELTEMVMDKMEAIEKLLGRKVPWTHWSDTSAYKIRSNVGSDRMDALVVERTSDGEIVLQPAEACKRSHGLRHRVRLIRQLLSENRLLVSAHCVHAIDMLANLPRGSKDVDFVPRTHRLKHIFDAMTYCIYSEMLSELEIGNQSVPEVGARLISV